MKNRGRYESVISKREELLDHLRRLIENTDRRTSHTDLGLIVQDFVPPSAKGHLSNQRRVAHEYRDALVETESITTGEITEERISFRRWRQPGPVYEDALLTTRSSEVNTVLREPLAHAVNRRVRIHYEWVWDGTTIHIVQADIAPDKEGGTSPQSVVGSPIADESEAKLNSFRVAEPTDAEKPGKLSNHFTYQREGFWQPKFYILDDIREIRKILQGQVENKLHHDLAKLTQTPLMIRTAYSKATVPLLPRSHLLTSADEATSWLRNTFAPLLRERNPDIDGITLIAHRYIHAVSSAFSIANPSRQEVLIEAMWGTPEGLYYYPCDVYMVHTLKENAEDITAADYERFRIKRTPRWKSHFVAPNKQGKFTRFEVKIPWDWKDTIQADACLCEIAHFTRKLATTESRRINLMWFIDCNTPDGKFSAIPWYHETPDARPDHSTFRRNVRDENYTIATESDLQSLESEVIDRRESENRVVIRLRPAEDVAIRDEAFAQRVGEVAKKMDAVVILHGASLSHIYYVLRRCGAEVVTRHLADSTTIREVHEKLVRDRIPEAVTRSGELARVATLPPEVKVAALKVKLVEEAFEVRDASRKQLVEEIADVLEVLRALAQEVGVSWNSIEHARASKAEKRGGFDKGFLLIETEAGGKPQGKIEEGLLQGVSADYPNVILTDQPPPLEIQRSDWGDTRRGADFTELIQNASISLTHPEWTISSSKDPFILQSSDQNSLTWQIEGRRDGSTLKIRLRIRIGKDQIELPLMFQQLSDSDNVD